MIFPKFETEFEERLFRAEIQYWEINCVLPDESEKQSLHSSVQFNTDNYKKTEIRQLPADINELVSDSNLILPANLNLNRHNQ